VFLNLSDAALTDVLRLSKGMTYKSALAGIPVGGGKSVIIGDPTKDKTRELLLAMGDFVESLGGKYITAEDSGTSVGDLAVIAENTRYASGVVAGEEHGGDPSPVTAYGVYKGMCATVDYHLRKDIRNVRVAVQGVGNVGYHLVKLLVDAGAEVTIADVNKHNIQRITDTMNVHVSSTETILSEDVDVIAPCALGGAINCSSLKSMKARVIAGAANNQLQSSSVGDDVTSRGLLYAPDYVINAGGVIDVYYQGKADRDNSMVNKHVEKIGDTLVNIYERAKSEQRFTGAVADQIAQEILYEAS